MNGDSPHEASEDPDLTRVPGAGRISRRSVYGGRIVRLSLDTVRFPDGSVGELELVNHPGASAVLALLDPPRHPDPRIVLVHQYRYAVGGLLFELPAGIPIGPRERWIDCAARELREETGFEAEQIRYLTSILTTPGFTDERIHLFAATGLEHSRADRDEDEFIEVVTMRFSEALDRVRTGSITDAKSLSTLLFASVFLEDAWEEHRVAPSR